RKYKRPPKFWSLVEFYYFCITKAARILEIKALPNLLHPPFPSGFLVKMLLVCYSINNDIFYMAEIQVYNNTTMHFRFNV
ncbi:MAG: hypothetical protein SO468_07820, partial [Prevotella sp.]|nr:hypothetical protein [Prevotella sp.]